MTSSSRPLASQKPAATATNRTVIAPKLHHTTFTTKRLDEMVARYELAVGLVPVFYGEDAAWLTNDEANHITASRRRRGSSIRTTRATPRVGTYFDPEKLVEARAGRLSFHEIHQKARAGDYLPGEIPQDIFLPELY